MPTWFRKGIDPGTIITLDQPVPSQWQIVKKLNEGDSQLTEAEAEHTRGCRLSFATTKLLCRDPTDHTKHAFMRIYLQLPYRGTEIDDADTRASQAATIVPQELIAYQELTQKSSITPKLLGYRTTPQDKSGPVPGGFAVWLAWEMVPGLRLGSKKRPDAFWTLDATEREEVRLSFVMSLNNMRKVGYFPDKVALSSLVWHKASKTVYFIGFRHRNVATGPSKGTVPDSKWIARFGLAKPNSDAWLKKGWNEDTSEWKW
ncbi:hypothetical protein BDV28DRAFT_163558 [Aspergillus coremiiformis]|uniref:Uncharacterized protein n=1 Tax=Aspergillus coremiiformis TaxID=138285 RepID=A0A5N6YVL9_9EURO|nr:hypothetical protein BDV28DRAFT_163558 [Aspergillus coremiiformis]